MVQTADQVLPITTMEEPLPEEVEKQSWKYVGYRRYTELISSDSDLLISRRFGTLNARVGLLLQDKISRLEQKLMSLDNEHSRRDADPINNGTLRDDIEEREALLIEISHHLDRYSMCLCLPMRLANAANSLARQIPDTAKPASRIRSSALPRRKEPANLARQPPEHSNRSKKSIAIWGRTKISFA